MELDDAYANSVHIPGGDLYYDKWEAAAAAFLQGHRLKEVGLPYGARPRETYDLFHPDRLARGTVVFVHGGYWMAGSAGMFSHLAAGAVAAGYACAMPSYSLAPDARLAEITVEVAAAIGAIAGRTQGPLYLVGHSAGGHLVARMGCADHAGDWIARVAQIMPISPIGDLAPMMQTSMNATLGIDAAEAATESPIHHAPPDCPVTIWVGAQERPAFVDQAKGLAAVWDCAVQIEDGRHHFDVIEGLQDPRSPMLQALFS